MKPVLLTIHSYKELIALAFNTKDAFTYCLELLDERLDLPFSLPGNKNIIIPKEQLKWFADRLNQAGHNFSTKCVISAGDLSPEKINKLRQEQFLPGKIGKRYKDIEQKRARIKELKKTSQLIRANV